MKTAPARIQRIMSRLDNLEDLINELRALVLAHHPKVKRSKDRRLK